MHYNHQKFVARKPRQCAFPIMMVILAKAHTRLAVWDIHGSMIYVFPVETAYIAVVTAACVDVGL
jgi:hypothetical protein